LEGRGRRGAEGQRGSKAAVVPASDMAAGAGRMETMR
jgi:hypothetical protein